MKIVIQKQDYVRNNGFPIVLCVNSVVLVLYIPVRCRSVDDAYILEEFTIY